MLSGTVPSSQASVVPARLHKAMPAQSTQRNNKRERSIERFQPPYQTNTMTASPLPPPVQTPSPPVVSLPDLAATHIAKSAKAGGATPSLSSILAAYKKDGNGDRALLVALLEAKRREDERLAARDVLAAEQLRAQNLHYAFYLASQYPPQFTQPQMAPSYPQAPSSHDGSSPRSRSGSVVSSAAASTYTTSSRKRRRNEPVSREEAMQALRGKIARSADGGSPPRAATVQPEPDELEDEDDEESEVEPMTPPRTHATVGDKRKAPQGKNFAMLLNAVDQERRGLGMTMRSS